MFREPLSFISRCMKNTFLYAKNKKKKGLKGKEDLKKYTVPGMFTSLCLQDIPEQMLLFIDFLLSVHLNQYF